MTKHKQDKQYPKDLHALIFNSIAHNSEKYKDSIFKIISAFTSKREVFFLGGIVRDTLLGRVYKDIDIVVLNNPHEALDIILPSSNVFRKKGEASAIQSILPNYKGGYKFSAAEEDTAIVFGTKQVDIERYREPKNQIDIWSTQNIQQEVASTVMAFNSIAVNVKTGKVYSTEKCDQFYAADESDRYLSVNIDRVDKEYESCKFRIEMFRQKLNLPLDPEYVLWKKMKQHLR
jgi:hypothetical protein